MTLAVIAAELMVELTTEEQQLLCGGRRRCPRRVIVPRCGSYFRERDGRGGFGDGFEDDFGDRF
jgi:hypothetical protein